MSDSSRVVVWAPVNRRLITALAPSARLRRQVLVLDHPLIEVSESKRITASRIARSGCRVWVLLSELDAQPNGYAKPVVKLFGLEQAEVLVISNELFELAARLNASHSELFFDRRPLRVLF
jgi:hypothetical protein